MAGSDLDFHFPPEIHLTQNPLAEAWLELQWRTTPQTKVSSHVPLGPLEPSIDTHYPLALGAFFHGVKKDYPVEEPLPAAQIPDAVLPPHTVRHRFRVAPDEWPVMQLGPGIATVNLISPYSWSLFREQAIFLRRKLREAYRGVPIYPVAIIMRYRNIFPLDYHGENVLSYMAENLNFTVNCPSYIPGPAGENGRPIEMGVNLGYTLRRPQSLGTIRLATALETKHDHTPRPVLLADLEVNTHKNADSPFENDRRFATWLDQAHAVIHEWFFALVDGPLRRNFEKG